MARSASARLWAPLDDPRVSAAALDATPDAFLILSHEPPTAYANTAAAALLGLRADEITSVVALTVLTDWTAPDGTSLRDHVTRRHRWAGSVSEHGHSDWHRTREALVLPLPDTLEATGVTLVSLREPLLPVGVDRPGLEHEADRAMVLSVMRDVRAQPSVEATSLALCEAVARIDGIDGAMLLVLPPKGDLVHMTNVGPSIPGFDWGAKVSIDNVAPLMDMTRAGPWSLDFADPVTAELIGADLAQAIVDAGITGTAYAGMFQDRELVGVLAVCSLAPDGAADLRRRLGALEQIGALAGMVMANQAVLFGRETAIRDDVRAVLDSHAYWSVLQPIVRLSTGQTFGFEALTRFEDGRSPDRWLADAHSVGLGVELEEACAASALISLGDAHPAAWLAINFSPEAVIGGVIGRLVNKAHRELVVEITEHSAIEEYEEIRRVMGEQPEVQVSIDDAGAGFASLRHILELSPAFVKLDFAIVHDIDVDPMRAAIVAGMVHFAAVTGTHLIAEGVETAGEAATLADLGVDLAQGHYFHSPAPVADFDA